MLNSIMNLINLENSSEQRYFLLFALHHLAPVIFSNKPAVLINFTKSHRNFDERWDEFKVIFNNSGLSCDLKLEFYEIKKQEEGTLVLFFAPELLSETINLPQNKDFLNSLGYSPDSTLDGFLATLKSGFAKGCPHEVGIFLGIPFEDVISFIENKGKRYLFNKYWKVYHYPERAKSIFLAYDCAKAKIREMGKGFLR